MDVVVDRFEDRFIAPAEHSHLPYISILAPQGATDAVKVKLTHRP